MDSLPDEILLLVLNFVSDHYCGFARVSRYFYSFYMAIKEEKVKDEKLCFEQFSPFIVFTLYDRVKIFKKACQLGSKYIINYLIEKGVNDWNIGMCCSARNGHRDLVNFFIEKGSGSGAYDLTNGMFNAASGGHKELVDFFIEKVAGSDANYWNKGMFGAARGGHKDLVDFFIEKGANHWDMGMYYAARYGHKDLVH